MKTPHEYKKQEKIKEKAFEEKRKIAIEKRLEILVAQSDLTSSGGKIKWDAPYAWEDEDLDIINNYLKKYGWISEHYTEEVGGYSMTARSEYSYDEHYLKIIPLKRGRKK